MSSSCKVKSKVLGRCMHKKRTGGQLNVYTYTLYLSVYVDKRIRIRIYVYVYANVYHHYNKVKRYTGCTSFLG